MKCRQIQKTLLATSGRRKLSSEVSAHVDACDDCRRWQDRLTEIDQAVKQIRVPTSATARSNFVQTLLSETATPSSKWYHQLPGRPWQRVVVAACASVMLILVWSGALTREGPAGKRESDPADPLLATMMQRHNELATAPTTNMRLQTLTRLSEDLDSETRNVARIAGTEDLQALANLYEDVVKKGIVVQADDVPADDRPKLLTEIADRLFRTSQAAELLAADVPPGSADPLRRISRIARDANTLLRTKARTDVAIQDPEPVRQTPAGG
jgi:hypothetical protein